jgi:tRNA dimethylallyltransferase
MLQSSKYNLIVILGPTASGKTKFAAQLAYRLNGEIISADSRQVYKDMTIGTGKDIDDYVVNGKEIKYHLIDILEPGYKYNLFEYQHDFFKSFESVNASGHLPIMCGGTGLYIEAVLKKYRLIHVPVNPGLREGLSGKTLEELTNILGTFKKLHNTTDSDTIPRAIRSIEIETYYKDNPDINLNLPDIKPLIIGINIDRQSRRNKITSRLETRLKEGMIEEVQGLLNKGIPTEDIIYYGLEYKYVTLHLLGELTYDEMFEKLNTAIHRFAKRQMTWFRSMERKGTKIHWMDAFEADDVKADKTIELFYKK